MSSGGPSRRRADHAAQFMPFAALSGYYDLVRDRERVVEPRHELTEEEAERLSRSIAELRRGDLVRVTHYRDGAYDTREGVVTRVDLAAREVTVVRTRISLDDVWRVERLPS